jgi:hypothetical protein
MSDAIRHYIHLTRRGLAVAQRDDARAALLALLALQGFHSVEHLAQWVQFHLLHWPPQRASGLLAPANAEVVHFIWNWSVAIVVAYVLLAGLRSRWGWVLLAYTVAHNVEHTYLFVRYLEAAQLLTLEGASAAGAQGLPGILGRGGWLDTQSAQPGAAALLCTLLPPLSRAPRLDVHFWWNTGTTALLGIFAWGVLRRPARPV